MAEIRKSWQYCRYRFAKWKKDRKLHVTILLLLILFFEYTKGIREMIAVTGVPITPFFLPFFFSDYLIAMGLTKIYILLSLIIIFCDVAKMDEEKYYFIIRTGRKNWIKGDILYIGVTSVLYSFFIFLCSIVFFLPGVKFENSWGKIIGTLAYTDAILQYGELFIIPSRVIETYQPVTALVLTLVLMVLGFFFLGLLIYTLNILSNSKVAGVCCASLLVFICPLISFMKIKALYWISPMTWMSIGSLEVTSQNKIPGVEYGMSMYLLLIGFLLLLLHYYSKKLQIGV